MGRGAARARASLKSRYLTVTRTIRYNLIRIFQNNKRRARPAIRPGIVGMPKALF
jgi:hypothetical protein